MAKLSLFSRTLTKIFRTALPGLHFQKAQPAIQLMMCQASAPAEAKVDC